MPRLEVLNCLYTIGLLCATAAILWSKIRKIDWRATTSTDLPQFTDQSEGDGLTHQSYALATSEDRPIGPALPGRSVLRLQQWWWILMQANHWMLIGETRTGKSTLARAMVAWFAFLAAKYGSATGKILIIDPHWSPDAWCNLPGVGAGRNYAEIDACFRALEREMDRWFKLLAAGGKPENDPLIIFIDEYLSCVANGAKKDGETTVARVFKAIIREAAKVGMHVVVLVQEDSVKAMGIEGEGASRRNLGKVWFGSFAVDMCSWLVGRRYPAALDYKLPEPVGIDTDELPAVASARVPVTCLWRVPDVLQDEPATPMLPAQPALTEQHMKAALIMLDYRLKNGKAISQRRLAELLLGVEDGGGTYSKKCQPIRDAVEPIVEAVLAENVTCDSVTGVITGETQPDQAPEITESHITALATY